MEKHALNNSTYHFCYCCELNGNSQEQSQSNQHNYSADNMELIRSSGEQPGLLDHNRHHMARSSAWLKHTDCTPQPTQDNSLPQRGRCKFMTTELSIDTELRNHNILGTNLARGRVCELVTWDWLRVK